MTSRARSLDVASVNALHPLSPDAREEPRQSSYFKDALTSKEAVGEDQDDALAAAVPDTPRPSTSSAPQVSAKARPPLFEGLSEAPAADALTSRDFLLSLRRAPHKLDQRELERSLLALRSNQEPPSRNASRSRSPSVSGLAGLETLPVDLVASLISSLSAELERYQGDLARSYRLRSAEVDSLRKIIKQDAMGVSDAAIERALLRASSAVGDSPSRPGATSTARWELRVKGAEKGPEDLGPTGQTKVREPDEESLHHDLEEAMSEVNVVIASPASKMDAERASTRSPEHFNSRSTSVSARLFAGLGTAKPSASAPVKRAKESGLPSAASSGSLSAKTVETVDNSKRSRSDSAVSVAESSRSSASAKSPASHGLSGWASGILGWSGKKPSGQAKAADEEDSDVEGEDTLHPGKPTRSSSISSVSSARPTVSSLPTSTVPQQASPEPESASVQDALTVPEDGLKTPHAAVTAVLSKRQGGVAALSAAHAMPASHPSSAVSSPMRQSFSAGSATGSLPMVHPSHYTAIVSAAQKWVAAGAKPDVSEGLLRKSRSVSPPIRAAIVQLLASLSQSDGQREVIEPIEEEPEAEADEVASLRRSASSASVPRSQSPYKPEGYLKSAKGQLGRALGLSSGPRRPPAKRSEPSLTLPGLVVDRQNTIFTSLPAAHAAPTVSAGGSGGAFELGTIVKDEERPPTFTAYPADAEADDMLFDRYGFAIDYKSGQRSLRELKQRTRQRVGEPLEQAVKQAMGPSPAETPQNEDRKLLQVESAAADTAPKSVKRLAAQLADINEQHEKTQQEGWDVFLRKRHSKLASLAPNKAVASHSTTATALGAALAQTEVDEAVWSENRIGIARLGRGDKDDWRVFKNLVRGGVPIAYRPAIWAEMSGAYELREPGHYAELVQKHEADAGSPCLKQIEADVGRTFGTNIFFGGDGPGIPKLRRILAAYSWHCPDIGYCQGMNMVAGTLLLTFPAEEDAFWMLTAIIERMLPSDYYTPTLLVSRADQRVLRDLFARVMPGMQVFFESMGVEVEVITFGWFLSLYANVMPIQTLLRVWDVLFCDGVVVLFRVALAMLRMHEEEIMACDSATSIYVFLRNVPTQLVQADRLIKIACNDFRSVKTKDVIALREKHVAEMAATEMPI